MKIARENQFGWTKTGFGCEPLGYMLDEQQLNTI